jgi:hypothetical protein
LIESLRPFNLDPRETSMLSPIQLSSVRRFAVFFACAAFAFPAMAEKPDRSDEETAEDAPAVTWRRDRPYGELGFPGEGFGPYWEYLRLATHHAVQEEIDLSPDQIERLQTVYTELMSAQAAWSKGGESLKPHHDKARKILTEEQSLRIEQITLQRRGVVAFLHEDIQETLALAPEQIETIRNAWQAHIAKAKEGWIGDAGRRSYHQVWKLALATLNESQRREFYQMTGPVIGAQQESSER